MESAGAATVSIGGYLCKIATPFGGKTTISLFFFFAIHYAFII